jgi:hypothetical protein
MASFDPHFNLLELTRTHATIATFNLPGARTNFVAKIRPLIHVFANHLEKRGDALEKAATT